MVLRQPANRVPSTEDEAAYRLWNQFPKPRRYILNSIQMRARRNLKNE